MHVGGLPICLLCEALLLSVPPNLGPKEGYSSWMSCSWALARHASFWKDDWILFLSLKFPLISSPFCLLFLTASLSFSRVAYRDVFERPFQLGCCPAPTSWVGGWLPFSSAAACGQGLHFHPWPQWPLSAEKTWLCPPGFHSPAIWAFWAPLLS